MNSELVIAIHALVYLNRQQCIVSSDSLAKSVCTNPARIRKVMSRLKAARLVGAKEGAVGGYYMVLPAEAITLDLLLDALQIELITSRAHTGAVDAHCMVASGMEGALTELLALLNVSCRMQLNKITIADIDARVMEKASGNMDELRA